MTSLPEHAETLRTLQCIGDSFPDFIVGGSFVLDRFQSLNRPVGDIDIIVPAQSMPAAKELDYGEFLCRYHGPIEVNGLRVDVMSVEPYWKILSYRDAYWGCRVQHVWQVIEIMRLAVSLKQTSKPDKRLQDLKYIEYIETSWM